jgi:hypothetical protein
MTDRVGDVLPASEAVGVLRHGRPELELIEASADADLLVVGMRRPDRFDELAHLPLGLRLAGRTRCVRLTPAQLEPIVVSPEILEEDL